MNSDAISYGIQSGPQPLKIDFYREVLKLHHDRTHSAWSITNYSTLAQRQRTQIGVFPCILDEDPIAEYIQYSAFAPVNNAGKNNDLST